MPADCTPLPPIAMFLLKVSSEQLALLESLLRPRVATLAELLDAQVQGLPPGDDSWGATEDQLDIASDAIRQIERARLGGR